MEFAPEDPEPAVRYLLEKLQQEKRKGPARLVGMLRKGFYRYLLEDIEMKNHTGFISAQVNPDGEVWPTSMDKKVMGDLREADHDFKEVWRSKQAEEVRSDIRRENPQDMLANSFYNNALCNPAKLLRLLYR
ncbi:MAG: SPASM domain-containing protein [Candidatus Nanohaloarchaea archaeon]